MTIIVTNATFEQEVLKHEGLVFVDFHADWCGPCKLTTPIIEELAKDQQFKHVHFVTIDVDENNELAAQYNVLSIPTFMIFKNGQVVSQFIGARDKNGFERELKAVE